MTQFQLEGSGSHCHSLGLTRAQSASLEAGTAALQSLEMWYAVYQRSGDRLDGSTVRDCARVGHDVSASNESRPRWR